MTDLPRDVAAEMEMLVDGEPRVVRVDSDRRVFVLIDGQWREGQIVVGE